jgi:hypothetical protein
LNFEAGALSKHLGDDGRVIPYLLDFRSANELKGPLSQFNVALADADGTWQLVKTLNAHSEFPQTEQDLRQTFDVWWPKLEQSLAAVRGSVTQSSARRSSDDKIDEILGLVRAQQNAVRVIRGEPVGRRYLVMPRRVQGRPTEYHLQEGLRVLNISHRAWEVFVRPASSRAFPDADLFDLFENQPEVDESERLAQQAELDGAMQAWEDAGRPGEQDDEDVGGDDTDGTGFHAVERR